MHMSVYSHGNYLKLPSSGVFVCVCVCGQDGRAGAGVATMVAIVLCAGVVSLATMVALHWWLVGW